MGAKTSLDFGFKSEPPLTDGKRGFEIVRIGPGKKIRCVVLSDVLICRRTHYVRRATVPCHDFGCEFCGRNVAGRWYGWLAVLEVDTGQTRILELPAAPLDTVVFFQRDVGTLRGAELRCKRSGKEINGPVWVDLARPTVGVDLLPAAPDVQLCLLRMWGLDPGLPGLDVAIGRVHKLNGAGGAQ